MTINCQAQILARDQARLDAVNAQPPQTYRPGLYETDVFECNSPSAGPPMTPMCGLPSSSLTIQCLTRTNIICSAQSQGQTHTCSYTDGSTISVDCPVPASVMAPLYQATSTLNAALQKFPFQPQNLTQDQMRFIVLLAQENVCQSMLDNCGSDGLQCLQTAPQLSRSSFCTSISPPSCSEYSMTPPLPVTRVPQQGPNGETYQIQCVRIPAPPSPILINGGNTPTGPLNNIGPVYHDIICEVAPQYGGLDCFYHCYSRETEGLTLSAFPVPANVLLGTKNTESDKCAFLMRLALYGTDFPVNSNANIQIESAQETAPSPSPALSTTPQSNVFECESPFFYTSFTPVGTDSHPNALAVENICVQFPVAAQTYVMPCGAYYDTCVMTTNWGETSSQGNWTSSIKSAHPLLTSSFGLVSVSDSTTLQSLALSSSVLAQAIWNFPGQATVQVSYLVEPLYQCTSQYFAQQQYLLEVHTPSDQFTFWQQTSPDVPYSIVNNDPLQTLGMAYRCAYLNFRYGLPEDFTSETPHPQAWCGGEIGNYQTRPDLYFELYNWYKPLAAARFNYPGIGTDFVYDAQLCVPTMTWFNLTTDPGRGNPIPAVPGGTTLQYACNAEGSMIITCTLPVRDSEIYPGSNSFPYFDPRSSLLKYMICTGMVNTSVEGNTVPAGAFSIGLPTLVPLAVFYNVSAWSINPGPNPAKITNVTQVCLDVKQWAGPGAITGSGPESTIIEFENTVAFSVNGTFACDPSRLQNSTAGQFCDTPPGGSPPSIVPATTQVSRGLRPLPPLLFFNIVFC